MAVSYVYSAWLFSIVCAVENPLTLELAHFSRNHFEFISCLPKC